MVKKLTKKEFEKATKIKVQQKEINKFNKLMNEVARKKLNKEQYKRWKQLK